MDSLLSKCYHTGHLNDITVSSFHSLLSVFFCKLKNLITATFVHLSACLLDCFFPSLDKMEGRLRALVCIMCFYGGARKEGPGRQKTKNRR